MTKAIVFSSQNIIFLRNNNDDLEISGQVIEGDRIIVPIFEPFDKKPIFADGIKPDVISQSLEKLKSRLPIFIEGVGRENIVSIGVNFQFFIDGSLPDELIGKELALAAAKVLGTDVKIGNILFYSGLFDLDGYSFKVGYSLSRGVHAHNDSKTVVLCEINYETSRVFDMSFFDKDYELLFQDAKKRTATLFGG